MSKVQPIAANDLLQAEQSRLVWRIYVPQALSIDDVLKDDYWAHVCHRLHLYDEIEAIAEDGSFYARLLVINRGVNDDDRIVKVQKLFYVDLQTVKSIDEDVPEGYKISFSPKLRYSIIQTATNVRVSSGHFTREDAILWFKKNEAA